MPYTSADARRQLLDTVAEAADELAAALASLSEAYEQLDDATADRLEEQLFATVQSAYGRIRRTHSEFAGRHALEQHDFQPAVRGAPGRGVRAFIDDAVASVRRADSTLGTLQDSMLPVEVGDRELRAGLSQVRELLGEVEARARELERTLGR